MDVDYIPKQAEINRLCHLYREDMDDIINQLNEVEYAFSGSYYTSWSPDFGDILYSTTIHYCVYHTVLGDTYLRNAIDWMRANLAEVPSFEWNTVPDLWDFQKGTWRTGVSLQHIMEFKEAIGRVAGATSFPKYQIIDIWEDKTGTHTTHSVVYDPGTSVTIKAGVQVYYKKTASSNNWSDDNRKTIEEPFTVDVGASTITTAWGAPVTQYDEVINVEDDFLIKTQVLKLIPNETDAGTADYNDFEQMYPFSVNTKYLGVGSGTGAIEYNFQNPYSGNYAYEKRQHFDLTQLISIYGNNPALPNNTWYNFQISDMPIMEAGNDYSKTMVPRWFEDKIVFGNSEDGDPDSLSDVYIDNELLTGDLIWIKPAIGSGTQLYNEHIYGDTNYIHYEADHAAALTQIQDADNTILEGYESAIEAKAAYMRDTLHLPTDFSLAGNATMNMSFNSNYLIKHENAASVALVTLPTSSNLVYIWWSDSQTEQAVFEQPYKY